MDAPLWTETHAPSLSELPQSAVRERLSRTVDEPMNLVVRGPSGAGKTAAVRALAAEAHADPDADLVEINVADFFERTKKQIREDPRFSRFLQGQTAFSKQYRRGDGRNKYKRNWSKRDMISHILQELSSYQPASGSYKTVLLDNAETIRGDFQQALRRVMERYHRSTQFVIATRQPSKLIPAIRSRCFPIPVRAPSTDETEAVLAAIADAEGVDAESLALNLIASKAGGDLRYAVLAAQHAATEGGGEITASAAETALSDVGHDNALRAVLDDAAAGEIRDARKTITSLLDDEGFGGQELLAGLLQVADTYPEEFGSTNIVRLHRLAGSVDVDLAEGNDPRLHLTHLLSAWAGGQSELDREAVA
ncbi:ATPase AAA [Halobellus salinus]|uniref:Replication factor C small subunit n=1 Tax=Halobellus salinus TaxID=931585 RepID=A0A830EGE2_9EURY|nr:AAA family ATPase [Halobellus salinus]GGJ07487.1 ATPase AAA [Halobellus salinus]SMP26121.1 replication factor C small subunit [Halobellus salinus]